MVRPLALALLLAPVAAAQPSAPAEAELGAALAPAPAAAPLRLAVVAEAADEGSSCGDGGSCGDDADCSGGDCGGADLGGAGCLVLGGCAVLTAGAGYGLWRIINGRRSPRPDTLDGAAGLRARLAAALGPRVELVTADADVTLSLREVPATRAGVGMGRHEPRLEVRARDRRGRALALSAGGLGGAHVVLDADGRLVAQLRDIVLRLAP